MRFIKTYNLIKNSKLIKEVIISLVLFLSVIAPAQALFVSPPKDPMPIIKAIFPQASKISEKQGDPLIRTIYNNKKIIGYALKPMTLLELQLILVNPLMY